MKPTVATRRSPSPPRRRAADRDRDDRDQPSACAVPISSGSRRRDGRRGSSRPSAPRRSRREARPRSSSSAPSASSTRRDDVPGCTPARAPTARGDRLAARRLHRGRRPAHVHREARLLDLGPASRVGGDVDERPRDEPDAVSASPPASASGTSSRAPRRTGSRRRTRSARRRADVHAGEAPRRRQAQPDGQSPRRGLAAHPAASPPAERVRSSAHGARPRYRRASAARRPRRSRGRRA